MRTTCIKTVATPWKFSPITRRFKPAFSEVPSRKKRSSGISGGCCEEEPNSSNRHLAILLETPRDSAPVFHNPLRLTASSPTHARVRNASVTIQVNWQGISTLCARKDLNFEHPAAAGRSEDEWALIRSVNVIMVIQKPHGMCSWPKNCRHQPPRSDGPTLSLNSCNRLKTIRLNAAQGMS